MASMEPISLPARSMLGTTPEVDSVILRFDSESPSPSETTSIASRTFSKL